MKTIAFETDLGSGYIEYTHRDDTFKNNTFDVIVEEIYSFYTEDNIEKSNDPKFDWYFPKDNLYVTNDELLEIAVIMNYEPTIPMRIRKFINDFFKK